MFAIINVGGKQEKVETGRYFKAEKINANVGDTVEFDCLLVCDDKGVVTTGTPIVAGVKAKAEVLEHGKDSKVVVYKYKAKKNIRKLQGHRQPYTKLKIVSIG